VNNRMDKYFQRARFLKNCHALRSMKGQMRISNVILTVLASTCFAVSAIAEPQPANLPYRSLCQMVRLDFTKTTGLTNELVSLKIGSKNPKVELKDIAMFIDSISGHIPLVIDTNGVMALPISKELIKENPDVVANQPKGSMTMEVSMAFGGKLKTSIAKRKGMIRYSGLFIVETMKTQMRNELTELNKEDDIDSALQTATVVHLQAKTDLESSHVTILAKQGDIKITPVKPGRFVMHFNPKLMKENPWIRLSSEHEWSINMKAKEDTEQ
jgi:hypothetical protein